ncbi:hypothetical protein [Methanoregula sp.]|uniref:hypothetical protein n=1 Tax=Methanoregula sp. TaxID=2052170 RepID=UPI002CC6E7AA|nr:hypothetical protein [Methanoregula sp.]HVP97022.1 hypothetical protein [Methanoregula sp.]
MQTIPTLLKRIYHTPACIALIPPLAVIIDYSLTFFLAGSNQMILQWEASLLVRYAVAHNILDIYLIGIILFYYGASYAVLHILKQTRYYAFGVGLIGMVSIIHVLGGLSWQMKTAWYSNCIMSLSFLSVIIALCLFGYSVVRQARSVP